MSKTLKSNFVVDFSAVVSELQVNVNQFVEYLNGKFRVNNRLGRTAQNLQTSINGNLLTLKSETYEFPKSYVRFLVKKFLATANNAAYRDAFRVVAHPKDKNTYVVKADVYNNEEEDKE
uniref:Large ribosomal subunit protein eL22 n=1 Tax=Trepomonas sp. PC1 TaxID=1076344 RepID=A0A146K4M5_9EUKA|eukprot:JAP91338.1 Ribosomal protein L22 [Trepomonas sp. PC1]